MRKIIALLFVTAFLILAVNVYSQETSPPTAKGQPREKGVKNTTTTHISPAENQNSPNKPMRAAVNRETPYTNQTPNKGSSGKPAENPPNGWDNWTTDPMKVFTACLTVCNVLLFLIQICLWISTKKSAEAAKKSAEALPRIERAYVFVDVAPVEGMISMNSQISDFKIPVTFSNIGRTPAILIKFDGDAIWGEEYPVKRMEIPGQFPPGGAVLPAGEKMTYKIPVHIQRDILSKIILREMKLTCCGMIEYQDVWKGRHETGFCWEIIPYKDERLANIIVSKCTLINDSPLNYYT